jgi:hypothetical protein
VTPVVVAAVITELRPGQSYLTGKTSSIILDPPAAGFLDGIREPAVARHASMVTVQRM